MTLTDQQTAFLARRTKLVRTWPAVGAALLIATAGLGGWLFFRHPLFANPVAVAARLDSGAIPDTTLSTMAVLLPVVVWMLLGLVMAAVLLAYAAFRNEKRLIAIIQTLQDNAE